MRTSRGTLIDVAVDIGFRPPDLMRPETLIWKSTLMNIADKLCAAADGKANQVEGRAGRGDGVKRDKGGQSNHGDPATA